MKCTGCHTELDEGKTRCSRCGKWNVEGETDVEDDVCDLEDVEASDHDRLVTGPWDAAWGGGIVKDSVTFFAGRPGAGKSSLTMQMAKNVVDGGGTVLYISKEETKNQLKARAVRLGLTGKKGITIASQFGVRVFDLCQKHKPRFVIVDSLPGLLGLGWHDIEAAESTLRQIKLFADVAKAPAIVISHINKKDQFSGPVGLEHLIDTTMFLQKDKKNPRFRVLVPEKNRFGAVDVRVWFEMGEKGLSVIDDPYDDSDDESEELDEDDV